MIEFLPVCIIRHFSNPFEVTN